MNRLNKEATNLYDAEEEQKKEKEKEKKPTRMGGGRVVNGESGELRRSTQESKKLDKLNL